MTRLPHLAIAVLLVAFAAPTQAQETAIRTEINPQAETIADTELFIDAAPAVVWQVLTDVDHWTEWMPEFASARLDGPLAAGSTIFWEPQGQTVESRLVSVEPKQRLVWNGTDGAVHIWELTPQGDGTLLRNAESIDDWQLAGGDVDGSKFLHDNLTVWNQRIAEQSTKVD